MNQKNRMNSSRISGVKLCEEGIYFECVCRGIKIWGKVDRKWRQMKPVPCTTGIVVRHKACRRRTCRRASRTSEPTTLQACELACRRRRVGVLLASVQSPLCSCSSSCSRSAVRSRCSRSSCAVDRGLLCYQMSRLSANKSIDFQIIS